MIEKTGVGFDQALLAMKAGKTAARAGWNGKGMFLYRVPAGEYPAVTAAAKLVFGMTVPYGAYYAMKTAQGNVVPWLASQTDLDAEDWEIYTPADTAGRELVGA